MKQTTSTIFLVLFSFLLILFISCIDAQSCKPSGKLRGKKPPRGQCVNDPDCCKAGTFYDTYTCSPRVNENTKATMTINNFEEGGDGGGPSECDNKYHSNETPVVALSTGWYNKGKRCFKLINIHYKSKSVKAKVVDECDTTQGCDDEHGYQPPCRNNIVDGSKAVWEALGVPKSDWGEAEITWSDA
ncbi:putative RlpA-like domain superfamily, kiwellin [Helianthus annuus]|nr:putative RlpA-like domain superfamily, kiwellin [Helianthus annuus]